MVGILIGLLGNFGAFRRLGAVTQKAIAWAIIAAVIGGACWLAYRHIYNEGMQAGQQKLADKLEKQKRAEWAEKEKQLRQRAAELEQLEQQRRDEYTARLQQLARAASETRGALDTGLRTIDAERIRENARIDSVPADELDGALRDLSAKLTAAD